MAESGDGLIGQDLENLHLHGRIGDMVLTADHMRDVEIDVIDDGRQRIEIAPVLAHQHRVGEGRGVDMAVAAHEIVPADDFVI